MTMINQSMRCLTVAVLVPSKRSSWMAAHRPMVKSAMVTFCDPARVGKIE
jgi:hypothetical protein